MRTISQLEFEIKTSLGKWLCKLLGHTKAGYGGRCKRCLLLLERAK